MQSTKWTYVLFGIAGILALCIVFGTGVFVGHWTGSERQARPFRFGPALLGGSHGAVGAVTKIEGNSVTLQLRDGGSQVVQVDARTRIDGDRRNTSFSSLKVGDQVVVIGSPNAKNIIMARYMRIRPASVNTAP